MKSKRIAFTKGIISTDRALQGRRALAQQESIVLMLINAINHQTEMSGYNNTNLFL